LRKKAALGTHCRVGNTLWTLPNKVLQRTNAAARATRSLWHSQLNTDTLARRPKRNVNVGWYHSAVLFYDDELPVEPTDGERALSAHLGSAAIDAIDATLQSQATRSWRKAARILTDALKAGAFPPSDDCYVHLHLRRLITLVEAGQLEAQGDLRNPRRSEVRLLDEATRSEPRSSTPPRVAALRTAVEEGDLDQVKALIEHGASVLESDRYGWLPLHWAAGADRVAIVRFFVGLGSPLEARATDQWTALHLACVTGSSRAVAALVRAGADVNSVAKGGNTSLHLALVPRKPRTVKILLLAGANAAVKDDRDRTPSAIPHAKGLLDLASLIEKYSQNAG